MALDPSQSLYECVFVQGRTSKGIGGYELKSGADRIFAFDYDHSGKNDHLVLFRGGTEILWILKRKPNGNFAPVFHKGDPSEVTGGYHSYTAISEGFAFDYNHSGKLDHMVFYQPGSGHFEILRRHHTEIALVFASNNGIGGYDLQSSQDLAFAFDYDHSGKQDHIVLYRPGEGTLWILKNESGQFRRVFAEGLPSQHITGGGIGGYNLSSRRDRAFAFDYDHSGKLDHMVLYRPGSGTISILRHRQGGFSPVYKQFNEGGGIGGYDLKWVSDRIFAFDHDGSGRADHLVLYRPGRQAICILKNCSGEFLPVYAQSEFGEGIGGYDLKSPADLVFGFDYNSTGRSNHLTLYRPGRYKIWILDHFRS